MEGRKFAGGRRTRTLVFSIVVVAVLATLLGRGVFAFFTGSISYSQSIATGTVAIGTNDSGSALFSLTGMTPSDPAVDKCIKVTMTGTRDSSVRLYSSLSGSLAPYVNLTVTRGTDSSPSFASCTNFTADATDYNGDGAGVIYAGLLSNYPTSYAGGVIDPKTASVETWSQNEHHEYKFTVSLVNNASAQGLTEDVTFTWEARNL